MNKTNMIKDFEAISDPSEMLKLVFKEIIELDVIYPSDKVKKFTFGIGECILVESWTGRMANGCDDMIPRDFRDYYLSDGTVIKNVPTRCVRRESE